MSTFPPRACGLASYTADLNTALIGAGHVTVVVASLTDAETAPPGTVALYRDHAASYRHVAALLSDSVDVVMIQHEFGIYGGVAGSLLTGLTSHLTVPYAVTLHTVTGEYTDRERHALVPLLDRAGQVHVFTDHAGNLLEQQAMPGTDIRVVAHGVPTEISPRPSTAASKLRLGINPNSPVVSTFGLLSPGKGIEVAITASALLRDSFESIRYVIAGRTHPDVVRHDGETYRRSLEQLCVTLDVDDHVISIDKFLTVAEIATLLAASDIFITPYAGAEQAISGTLSYAIAAGVPFVSTPYRYATEMAARGAGLTVPWQAGPAGIADAARTLLSNRSEHARCAQAARDISHQTSWPVIARTIADHLTDLTTPHNHHRNPQPNRVGLDTPPGRSAHCDVRPTAPVGAAHVDLDSWAPGDDDDLVRQAPTSNTVQRTRAAELA